LKLRLHRDLAILLIAVFLIAAAEESWWRFVPVYLRSLGAPIAGIAAYGAFSDFLDAVYQLPGGVFAATAGYRRALTTFNVLAVAGYLTFAIATRWWVLLLALPLIMSWRSFSLPATFSMIADAMPSGERSLGFAYQSIVRRIPLAVAPVIGGIVLTWIGLAHGMRILLLAGAAVGICALLLQMRYRLMPPPPPALAKLFQEVTHLDRRLKRLLFADILVRFGQGIGEVFIVIYVIGVVREPPLMFGWLVAIAMLTSLFLYIPVARIADRYGRGIWIALTYAFFALFPLVLGIANSPWLLAAAFLLMGLREIGEPARKSLIVDLARTDRQSVDVGAYYLARGLAVFPASFAGGALWRISPQTTFFGSAVLAAAGTIYFIMSTLRETRNRSGAAQ
jgi:MFS family permease